MREQDDESLLKAANAGDSAAFGELVRRYEDRLYRIAKTMLIDNQLAADAVQECFLRAFRGFARFRFRAAVYTWLYAILRNVCRELNRQQPTSGRGLSSADEDETTESLSDSSPSLDDALSTERQLNKVMKIIKSLPERQREIFVLRILEGLSVEQTARLVKCRPGTVKTHLYRAMKVIRATEREQNN